MGMWDEFSFLEDADKLDNWSLENWCKTHGERGLIIAKEWTRERNLDALGNSIDISDVSEDRTRVKYWWKCSGCGNDFQMAIRNRTEQGQGCCRCGWKAGGIKNRQNAYQMSIGSAGAGEWIHHKKHFLQKKSAP